MTTIRTGVIDRQEFENHYTPVKNAFTQLDLLLTQVTVASRGCDLVLRAKSVIIYRNTKQIIDITDLVKRELKLYL